MKKIVNNPNGYTLIIVLMITAVFTVFALSFIVISANTTKQNEIIEQKSQSVAIAEMGVTYFEKAIRNIISSKEKKVLDEVKALRVQHSLKKAIQPNGTYIDYGRDRMMWYIEEEIKSLNTEVKIKSKTSSKFLIEPISNDYLISKNKGFEVSYKSTGTEESKSTTIEGKLKVDFSDFLFSTAPSFEIGKTPILEANKIQDPGNLQSCDTNGNKIEFNNINCQINRNEEFEQNDNLSFNNSTVKIKGSLTMKNMNNTNKNDIIESTIYIQGDMSAGNLNNLSQMNLFIGGSLKGMNFTGSGLSNSVVEIKGTGTMDNIKLIESTMFIGKGPTTIHQINEMVSSILFVDGDTAIHGINMGDNSLICVNGDLQISSKGTISINETSKIYAKSSNHSSVITTPNEFNNACYKPTSSIPEWGNINLVNEYNYNYK